MNKDMYIRLLEEEIERLRQRLALREIAISQKEASLKAWEIENSRLKASPKGTSSVVSDSICYSAPFIDPEGR